MSEFIQKWTVVSFVEPPASREFDRSEWPLHVTLAPIFACSLGGTGLTGFLAESVYQQEAFDLKVVETAIWAKPVALLDKSPDIMQLHRRITGTLRQLNSVFDEPEYIGRAYKPHCTSQQDRSLEIGDSVQIASISLVDMFPGGNARERRIVKTIPFAQDQGTSGAPGTIRPLRAA